MPPGWRDGFTRRDALTGGTRDPLEEGGFGADTYSSRFPALRAKIKSYSLDRHACNKYSSVYLAHTGKTLRLDIREPPLSDALDSNHRVNAGERSQILDLIRSININMNDLPQLIE